MGYNVPITLIFFNRPETLKLVFDKVKAIKPKKLFLVQDGPRDDRPDDNEKILECRKIVENIDWECDVQRNYSETNLGCGMRPQTGITWTLSIVDRTIVLEDDCIPDMSFFAYCEEMLEKYKNDERVAYISGLNHFEEWDFGGSSYGFTKEGAIWGWAVWKRSWDRYDYYVNGIEDEYVRNLLEKNTPNAKGRINNWTVAYNSKTTKKKLSYWDAQWGFVKFSQNQLVIVPKYNLINNVGVGVTSTHAATLTNNHKKYMDYCNMPTKPLEFPLIHPKYLLCDSNYDDLLQRCNKKIQKRLLITNIFRKLHLKR